MMKKLKLFFACLLMAVLSIGQVWGADATMSGGTSVTVGGKSAVKVGASKSGGSMTITVGANATSLSFYIAAWSGDNTSVSVTPTANVGTTALSPTQDSGISGTGNSFTLNGTESTYYTTITLSNITAETAITLASSAGKNRFVVWGATYETGGGSTPATVSVESVSLNKDATSLEVGANETLTATVSPNDATNKNVTWESSNNNVATVSSTGVVTAVAEGNATITCKSAADNTKTATCAVTVTPAEVPTLTFDFSAKGYENGVQYSSIDADANITITFGNGDNDGKYYNTGTAMRVYSSGHMTIAGEEGVTISKIVLEFGTGDGSNEITTNGGTYANGKWTGSAQSVTFNVGGTSGHRRIKVVKVFYEAEAIAVAQPTIEGETPFLNTTTVTLTQADADAIYYTTNGVDPTIDNNLLYSNPFTLDANKTVKAIAVKGGVSSSVAEKVFSKIETKTVAQAIAAIPNQDDVVNNQYVEGFVCTAGTSVNNSGQMTYYISDDGSETARLQIYLGKNLNNTAFAAANDLALGDKVIVYGQLKNYKGTKEMNSGNYLVSKVAAAVAAPIFSPNGGGFMGETDVTITCATEGSAIYYTLDGTTPSKSSTPYTAAIHLNATTTITAVAYVGDDASLVISKTFTLTAPMTVAEALAALDTESPINNVAVAGIISTAPTANPSSGKLTYYISDDGSASDELEVYKGFGVAGASFSDKTDLQVGDQVTVFGNLTIYNTTKEFAEGNRLLEFNRPVVAVTDIDLTESTAEVEVDKTVTLHASVVPANATNKTIVWSVQSGDTYASVDQNGVVTGIAAGEAVIRAASDEDATIFAECTVTVTEPAPLSPWASVYTSNVTLSTEGGTSASAAKVKFYGEEGDGYDAIKAGTGSAQGAVVVNVPAGATALHFHAYGWTSESVGLTVTAPAGVTVSPATEISINSNSGIANNSPFTLAEGSDPKTDAYYAVSLSGNTEPVALTISATAGKRFVLFGVNQEGGLVLESIAISGTATELEYNEGDHFDPDGLKVMGHYSDNSDAEITEGIDWAFDPDPLTEGTTSVSVTATAGGFTSDAFVVNGLTVNGAAPLSPWASVYTSNVTLSTEGGTSASAAKVKFYGEEGDGYDAIKAGTGSAQGAVVVNVPAGATALHFHAYGWNSESVGLTVTAPTGVTVSPATEISINSNSGIASNSPFTLAEGSDPKTDAYYAVSLSGNTEATNITISATSGKRFVLFGVNQEGGLVLESISITGTATALEYTDGQHFDPTGLSVTGHYSDASTAPITEDIVWAFDPDPLTEGTTSVSVTATAAGFTSAAFVVDGLTVAGAAPLSPWATTWTSNLDDITGSKVKFYGEETEYAALKAGSSGTAGSATLNIPAQATELHLHAYGWNSEDVTLSITAPAGVTVTPASITLNRNSGFASNSPFTLAEGSTPQTDAYYALSLSGNTDAIELTITATEGKRFLLFGVNQEGGQLPVLESIEIKGDLTTKTGYKAGDALNLDGLTVEATYSIGGVAQTPVDITDKLGDGLTLTYDPLVENQTEVTITATYGDKSDDITITGLDPVASADPKIYVSTLNVDFGSVEVGEAVPANETVTVTLTNVAAATATLDGEGFSISPSTLTASGDITVSVVASTASAANYSATLTISDDAAAATAKVISLSFAVTAPVVNEEYELVSDVNTLAAGDQIIIVAENAGTYYTLDGSITSQYFPSTAVSISAGIITAPTTSAIILGKDEDNWTMSMGGQLIGATAAKKASLGNGSASNTWTIAIAENVATITNTAEGYGSLQFNYNSGNNSRFLNYTSAQTAVAIYKKVAAPEPEYETVRSGLEINRYYTVCLPKKVTAIKGASFWTLKSKSQDGATAYLEEETNNLPFAAGKPFIIQATAENLEVIYEGAATEDAGTNGALHGTLVYMDAAALAAAGPGVYMLFSNELRPVGENNHLDANRAYVLLSELNAVPEAPQNAPGRRVVAMPMEKDVTTDINALNAAEAPVKIIIDGNLFILRGEKLYDATGRQVK